MTASLDAAYAALQPYGCVLRNGLSNHAPMVAEVLERRAPEALGPWVERELPRIARRPPPTVPPDEGALGDPARFTDWATCFARSIVEDGVVATLRRWVPRLAPGFAAAAGHGVIRVGHAAHAWRRADTAVRRQEVADALAAWASDFETLPVREGPARAYGPEGALARVERVPEAARRPRGSITRALKALPPSFGERFRDVAADDPEATALEAARAFARLFVRSALDHSGAIVFTHALTGLLAVRRLAWALEPEDHRALVRHAVHLGLALHAVYSRDGWTTPEPPAPAGTWAEAVAHGDEHVIKLTDAALVFFDATGDAFFPALPGQAMAHIPVRA